MGIWSIVFATVAQCGAVEAPFIAFAVEMSIASRDTDKTAAQKGARARHIDVLNGIGSAESQLVYVR